MDKNPLSIKEIRNIPLEQDNHLSSKYIKHLFAWNEKTEQYILNRLFEKGREYLGKEFIISDQNAEKVINIIRYLSGNGGYDNRKGIYLFGQFGVGKTTFMTILNYVFSELPPFGVDGRRLNLNGFGSISIEKIIEHIS